MASKKPQPPQLLLKIGASHPRAAASSSSPSRAGGPMAHPSSELAEGASRPVSLDEMLNMAFALAYFIHGDKEAALKIATGAAAKLEVATSAQHKRLYYKPTGRALARRSNPDTPRNKVSFGNLHLLQRLVYIESEPYEKQREQVDGPATPSEEEMIIHFIKHLVKITIRRNSFYVALGLSRLLHNYGTTEAMEIYNLVVQDPERVKDDYYYRSRKRVLMSELRERFGDLLQIQRGRRREERFRAVDSPERYAELVRRCLTFFTPWQTPCFVPVDFNPLMERIPHFSYQGHDEEDKIEVNRIHALLHPDCYRRLTRALGFDPPGNRLEVPHFFFSTDGRREGPRGTGSGGGQHAPRLDEAELLAVKEELAALADRRKRATAGLLRVVVDGIERARLDLKRARHVHLTLKRSAELVELKTEDAGGELLLASHLLVHSEGADDLTPNRSSIVLEGGQKLSITVSPAESASGEETAAVAHISYRENNPLRAASLFSRHLGFHLAEALRPDRWRNAGSLIPIMAGVILAVCAASIMLYLQKNNRSIDQLVATNERQQEKRVPPEALSQQPGPGGDHSSSQGAGPETPAKPAWKQPPPQTLRSRDSSRRGELPAQNENITPPARAAAPGDASSETAIPESETTRDLDPGASLISLAEVKRIYVEVEPAGDESPGGTLRGKLVEGLRAGRRLVPVDGKDAADALLKISMTPVAETGGNRSSIKDSKPEAVVVVTARLINAGGKVIWPASRNLPEKRYQGTIAGVSAAMIKDLLEAIRRQERKP